MARNILLTFVGATPYKKCVYCTEERTSRVVRFVQEALAEVLCSNWSEEDKMFVFLTEAAETQNWEGKKYVQDEDTDGLAKKLADLNLACRVRAVRGLTDGFSESDIWTNFEKIFDCLKEGDKVWLDVTNAFRSIPIFTSVLLDYARFLKKVEIQAVYYGAFDTLGPSWNIEERIPNPANRRVPLLNLVNVVALQKWTNAANDFLTHGNSETLTKLSRSGGLTNLAETLERVTLAFSVSRGREITQGDIFQDLREEADGAKDKIQEIPPLEHILNKVNSAFSDFSQDRVFNGITAAEWCLGHKLIQQGITILRETIISIICIEAGLNDGEYKYNRRLVEIAFNCYGRELDSWHTGAFTQKQVHDVIDSPSLKALSSLYQELSHQYRNDINHGGFLNWAKPAEEFEEILEKSISEIKRILNIPQSH